MKRPRNLTLLLVSVLALLATASPTYARHAPDTGFLNKLQETLNA